MQGKCKTACHAVTMLMGTLYNIKILRKLPSFAFTQLEYNIFTFYISFTTGSFYMSSLSPAPLSSVYTSLPQTTTTAHQSSPCELVHVHVAHSYTPAANGHIHISQTVRAESLLGIISKCTEYVDDYFKVR